MTDLFTLYGAQISNYSAKVRSYLIYKRLLFQEVTPSNAVYDRILTPVIGYRMMPVLRTPEGALLQDSTDIIDALEARFPEPSVYPRSPRQRLTALLLEAYFHDWFRIPAMYYRWAFPQANHDYLVREFGRMYEPTAQPDDQIAIGDKSCAWTRGRLPMLGVTARTAPAIEAWTEDLLVRLDRHFAHHAFLLGGRPCTADFALMGPLYGHLYHDPYSITLMRRIAPNVVTWIERMNAAPEADGEFLPDDQAPEALFPLLRHARTEYLPAAFDTIALVGRWIEAHPGEAIPRFLGEHTVELAGVRETKTVWTCIQYMVQRPLAFYQTTFGRERDAIDGLLETIGGTADLSFQIAHPVQRRKYQLLAR